MHRFGGRYAPNLENEVRRAVKEPISAWRQEWVAPSIGTVKILKWVKTEFKVEFGEEDDEQQEMMDDAIIEPHLNSEPAIPEAVVEQRPLSLSGGLGSIAPIEPPTPVSAVPAHMTNASMKVTPSPGDSPAAAANPQVAGELHPPPSGLPTKEEEEQREEESAAAIDASAKVEEPTLWIEPSAEVQQEEIVRGQNDDQVQVAPEQPTAKTEEPIAEAAAQEDVEMTFA